MVKVSAPTKGQRAPRAAFSLALCVLVSVVLAGCGGDSGSDSDSSPPPDNPDTSSESEQAPTELIVSAGADLRVRELTQVELRSNVSGAAPLSYRWRQTSGEPQLSLSGADLATASFQAPDVDAANPQSFNFELEVTDANGASATDQVSVLVQEVDGEQRVSGVLRYEYVPSSNCRNGLDYSSIEERPIRGATVQLLEAASGQVLDTTYADADGAYSLALTGETEVQIRVRAELKHSEGAAWDVEVRDNTSNTSSPLEQRPLYVLDSRPFSPEAEHELNLTAATGWDGRAYSEARAAAPFAILDTIYTAMTLVLSAEEDVIFPPLDVFWSVNNGTARPNGLRESRGEIGTSFYDPGRNSLFLLGKADDDTEEFDGHVIAHEWGHYFEDNFSRSDSIGGPHRIGQRLDMRLAFGEGWASALAGMVTEDSLYCDTFGAGQAGGFSIDLERANAGPAGWFNEVSVLGLLYDLWDEGLGDDDPGSIGFAPIYDVFIREQLETEAFTSIFSFLSALKNRYPEHAALVDTLMLRYDISGQDAYARGESNDGELGTAQDVLPVYTQVAADGNAVRLCSNSQFDSERDGNKLSVFRYLRLALANPGSYRISVRNVAPTESDGGCAESDHSDPDVLLFRRGQVVHRGTSCRANEEITTTQPLDAGNYVLSLSEFRYADVNTPDSFPSQSCFDISVRPAN